MQGVGLVRSGPVRRGSRLRRGAGEEAPGLLAPAGTGVGASQRASGRG